MNFLRESIYFSPSSETNSYGSNENDNSSNIVSDYVHNLANGIYKEFESIILHHGENDVKNLMPMVVSCLETLDRVYSEKHNIEVEFELLKEDSSQLMGQYEREKNQRRNAEENLFRVEDTYSETSKKYEDEIHKLKSMLKMSDIRIKNFHEQVTRLEKKESERQFEYDKLLSRHHELLRYHRDYLEKSRNLHSDTSKVFPFDKNELKYHNNRLKFNTSIDTKQSNFDNLNLTDSKLDETLINRSNLLEELEFNNDIQIMPHEWDFSSTKSDDECLSDNDDVYIGGNALPLDDELAGMRHEIESIIKENNDLIATKNALNIVKDDLISKLDEANSEIEIFQHENNSLNTMKTSLKLRINNLEVENKGLRQEVAILQFKTEDAKEEENIPMSQRKRFTRLEMARVLMERNQYKEKLLELEEYIKWIKMLRNRKEKKLSIWERFSRLFKSNNERIHLREDLSGQVKTENIKQERINNFTIDSLECENSDTVSNCLALKDPNRQQINGWSLSSTLSIADKNNLPIPIYCRPLLENQTGLKITCAVTVNTSGAFNLKGGTIVGSSIFYENEDKNNPISSDLMQIEEKINKRNVIKEFGNLENESFETLSSDTESHVWICTSSDNQSQIIIIDANKPAEYLDTFIIPSPVQCLGSVPGTNSNDYISIPNELSSDFLLSTQMDNKFEKPNNFIPNFKVTEVDCIPFESVNATICTLNDFTVTRNYNISSSDLPVNTDYNYKHSSNSEILENADIQPTIWIGCRNGDIFVHPATGNRSLCLHHIRLCDSITNIVHQNSRVFVSLANGSMIVFCRYLSTETQNEKIIGLWQMSKYHLFEPENYNNSIRCLESVALTNKVWMGFKNQILVIDNKSLTINTNFEVHPRLDYTVRQMCPVGDGVWVSLRLDTTLRLFNSYNYQHLQDLNVEPHINKLIESSMLGLSLLRITCLSTSCHRLWIGTNKGIIITAPFVHGFKNENIKSPSQDEMINGLLNNTEDNNISMVQDNICTPTFIPHINNEDLQLSYHGHRDAVKFFTAIRCRNQKVNENLFSNSVKSSEFKMNNSTKSKFYIISGGEGYRDFRFTENKADNKAYTLTKNSGHLIVWKLHNAANQ